MLQYTYLQLLDFLTTLAFLMQGAGETIVRWLPDFNLPIAVLAAVKLLALALGWVVWTMNRRRLLARMNVLFAALVAWNIVAIIAAAARAA
jgi:hypothetical protein